MSMSGIDIEQDVVDKFSELKLKKTDPEITGMVMKIGIEEGAKSKTKSIAMEHWLKCKTNDDFLEYVKEKFLNEPRYLVFDVQNPQMNAQRKLVLFTWNPDNGPIKTKMVYASSTDAISKKLEGVAKKIQVNDIDDFDFKQIVADLF